MKHFCLPGCPQRLSICVCFRVYHHIQSAFPIRLIVQLGTFCTKMTEVLVPQSPDVNETDPNLTFSEKKQSPPKDRKNPWTKPEKDSIDSDSGTPSKAIEMRSPKVLLLCLMFRCYRHTLSLLFSVCICVCSLPLIRGHYVWNSIAPSLELSL